MANLSNAMDSSIEIYLDKTLGIGSYGQVCKARYGRLPCAAKVLHPTLVQFGTSHNSESHVTKFQQECEFLSTLKHPNIVQHLGTTTDPATGRPVLLVELLDQSLTSYLKESQGPLPYHTQVNISNDVALALSYLHSNGIIHRDLSSNNVLLLGKGGRAKVTDFGLYKLIGTNPCVSPLAHTQGTLAYMPPEVLIIPPNYTSQMDCFSLGVLMVQIITKNFPDPGDAHRITEDDTHSTGRVVEQIPEQERRKQDISLITPDHPLLPIAISCLHDRSKERPSANELCETFAELKSKEKYTVSAENFGDQSTIIQKLKEKLEAKEQEDIEFKSEMQKRVDEHEKEKKALTEELAKLNAELEECRLSFQQSQDDEREKHKAQLQAAMEKHQRETEKIRKELATAKQRLEDQHSRAKRKEALVRKESKLEIEAKDAQHDEEKEALKEELEKMKLRIEDYKLQLQKKEESERDRTTMSDKGESIEEAAAVGTPNEDTSHKPVETTPQEDRQGDQQEEKTEEAETFSQQQADTNTEAQTSEASPQTPEDTKVQEASGCPAQQPDNDVRSLTEEPEAGETPLQQEESNTSPPIVTQEVTATAETSDTSSSQQALEEPTATPSLGAEDSQSTTDSPHKSAPDTETSPGKEPVSRVPPKKPRRPLLCSTPSTLHLIPSKLTWRRGQSPPENISSLHGTVVVHKDTAYFSHYFDLYSYSLHEDKWSKLQPSQYQSSSLAIIDNQLTTIGGISKDQKRTKCLFSLVGSRSGMKWEELYPPMLTQRLGAAALTTPTHLIVVGGRNRAELGTIEVMDRHNFQWSLASNLPEPMAHPQIALSMGYLYVCTHQTIYSCSLEKFLLSSHDPADQPMPNGFTSRSESSSSLTNGNGLTWSKLADIPTYCSHTLCGYGDQVLAVGGQTTAGEQETAAIHAYDRGSTEWNVIGEMPTAQLDSCVSVFEEGELVVVGGWSSTHDDSHNTYIGTCSET